MRWEGNRESDNVEDRRDDGGDPGGSGGGGGFGLGGRSIGIGTLVIALLGGWALGVNPLTMLNLLSGGGSAPVSAPSPAHRPPAQDRTARFVSTVLADTEDVWTDIFRQRGGTYVDPKLVLFRGATPTACGTGQAAMGPFYCPADQKVYIDLDFFQTLKDKLGAPGEFAQAYVIAHEVGHHVQNLLGISTKVDQMRRRVSQTQYNALSVRLELQADCLAGVWAQHSQQSRQWLEPGDIDAAVNAAQQIGDDTLQKETRGYAVPDSFTHGSSAQRVKWLRTGWQSGNMDACDTFNAKNL